MPYKDPEKRRQAQRIADARFKARHREDPEHITRRRKSQREYNRRKVAKLRANPVAYAAHLEYHRQANLAHYHRTKGRQSVTKPPTLVALSCDNCAELAAALVTCPRCNGCIAGDQVEHYGNERRCLMCGRPPQCPECIENEPD